MSNRKDMGQMPLHEGAALAREAVSIALNINPSDPVDSSASVQLVNTVEEICLHHGQAVGAISFLVQMLVMVLKQSFSEEELELFLSIMWSGMAAYEMEAAEEFTERMERLRKRIEEQPDAGGWDDADYLEGDDEPES